MWVYTHLHVFGESGLTFEKGFTFSFGELIFGVIYYEGVYVILRFDGFIQYMYLGRGHSFRNLL